MENNEPSETIKTIKPVSKEDIIKKKAKELEEKGD